MPASGGYTLSLALLPELLLGAVAIFIAVLAAVRPGERPDLYRWLAVIALLGSVAASGFVLWGMRGNPHEVALLLWNGGLSVDHFSLFVTVTAAIVGLVSCLLSDVYLRRIGPRAGAFFAMLLMAVAGVSALAAEHEMLTFFAALEVVILCLTGITALVKTDERGAETAWKLLIESGVASATVLYGLAILYGLTGSSNLSTVAASLGRAPALATLGTVLVLAGLTFALGIAPLRRWISRAGEATPAVVAGFVITIGTTAGAVAFVRIGVSGLGASVHPWTGLAAVLVVVGLAQAALFAQRETRVTRLVGLLASAQAAMLLLALLALGPGSSAAPAQGVTAFLFALVIFAAAIMATFGVLVLLQTAGLPDGITDFRGLGHRSPPTAALFAITLATLAGVPPLAGFVARLLVVEASFNAGYGWLAVLAVVATVLLAIPVIRLIASMYAETGDEQPFTVTATSRLARIVVMVCCLSGFYLTFLAQPLLMLARGGAGPLL